MHLKLNDALVGFASSCCQAKSARAVFHVPSFASNADKATSSSSQTCSSKVNQVQRDGL